MVTGHYNGRLGVIISIRENLYDIKILPKGERRRSKPDLNMPGIIITNCKSSDFV